MLSNVIDDEAEAHEAASLSEDQIRRYIDEREAAHQDPMNHHGDSELRQRWQSSPALLFSGADLLDDDDDDDFGPTEIVVTQPKSVQKEAVSTSLADWVDSEDEPFGAEPLDRQEDVNISFIDLAKTTSTIRNRPRSPSLDDEEPEPIMEPEPADCTSPSFMPGDPAAIDDLGSGDVTPRGESPFPHDGDEL